MSEDEQTAPKTPRGLCPCVRGASWQALGWNANYYNAGAPNNAPTQRPFVLVTGSHGSWGNTMLSPTGELTNRFQINIKVLPCD